MGSFAWGASTSQQTSYCLLTFHGSVIGILLPTTFFYALSAGGVSPVPQQSSETELLTNSMREEMLHMGRGIAVILLVVYIGARVFLYKPTPKSPVHMRIDTRKLKMSSWSCIVMLVVTVSLMAVTVSFVSHWMKSKNPRTDIPCSWSTASRISKRPPVSVKGAPRSPLSRALMF